MLNQRGGYESDLTAHRLSETAYRAYVGSAALRRDIAWSQPHPTAAELRAYEARAHQLRALAVRDGVVALTKFVKSAPRRLATGLHHRLENWVGIELEPIPPHNT